MGNVIPLPEIGPNITIVRYNAITYDGGIYAIMNGKKRLGTIRSNWNKPYNYIEISDKSGTIVGSCEMLSDVLSTITNKLIS